MIVCTSKDMQIHMEYYISNILRLIAHISWHVIILQATFQVRIYGSDSLVCLSYAGPQREKTWALPEPNWKFSCQNHSKAQERLRFCLGCSGNNRQGVDRNRHPRVALEAQARLKLGSNRAKFGHERLMQGSGCQPIWHEHKTLTYYWLTLSFGSCTFDSFWFLQ